MFTYLNKQGVKSDEGFIVQSMNRFTVEYREESKIILVSVERGLLEDGKACVYIYLDELEKWNDGTPVKNEQQQKILKNFKEAMEFMGVMVLIAQ